MADSTNKIRRSLRNEGYIVTITKGNHLKVTHPTRPGMVFTGATPGNQFRIWRTLHSDLRRVFHRPYKETP